MHFNHSFTLSALAPAPRYVAEKLVEYAFDEFSLNLPAHWRRCAVTDDDALHWHSSIDDASVAVSIDAHDITTDYAPQLAETWLRARDETMEALAPGQVDVLQRSATPYPGGGGLELMYGAQLPHQVCVYLGYITTRKVFNFTLTCVPDKFEAAALFERFAREHLRVKVP